MNNATPPPIDPILAGLSRMTVMIIQTANEGYLTATYVGPNEHKPKPYAGYITCKPHGRSVVSTDFIFDTAEEATAHMVKVMAAARALVSENPLDEVYRKHGRELKALGLQTADLFSMGPNSDQKYSGNIRNLDTRKLIWSSEFLFETPEQAQAHAGQVLQGALDYSGSCDEEPIPSFTYFQILEKILLNHLTSRDQVGVRYFPHDNVYLVANQHTIWVVNSNTGETRESIDTINALGYMLQRGEIREIPAPTVKPIFNAKAVTPGEAQTAHVRQNHLESLKAQASALQGELQDFVQSGFKAYDREGLRSMDGPMVSLIRTMENVIAQIRIELRNR